MPILTRGCPRRSTGIPGHVPGENDFDAKSESDFIAAIFDDGTGKASWFLISVSHPTLANIEETMYPHVPTMKQTNNVRSLEALTFPCPLFLLGSLFILYNRCADLWRKTSLNEE